MELVQCVIALLYLLPLDLNVKNATRKWNIICTNTNISVCVKQLKKFVIFGKDVKTGVFGADMQIEMINNGPTTIIIDTKNKE